MSKDASIENKIQKVIDEFVNPVLAKHYGSCSVSSLEDGVLYVKFSGACGSCPSASETLEDVVKEQIMSRFASVRDVQLDNSVSDDLWEMAKKILNKEL